MSRTTWLAGFLVVVLAGSPWMIGPPLPGLADEKPLPKKGDEIDATTLRHKVLCGYQGWFRCPDDPAKEGWRHWSRDARQIAPDSLAFEMWPDMTEYEDDEKYPAPGFAYPDGKPAHLFSSANPKTVDRHFQWMRQYGIDGVFLQRFVVNLKDRSVDQVLANVQGVGRPNGSGVCPLLRPDRRPEGQGVRPARGRLEAAGR